jgi:hypothetical protein
MAYETEGSMPHSQGLSNNSYPDSNQPNYPQWYLSLQGPLLSTIIIKKQKPENNSNHKHGTLHSHTETHTHKNLPSSSENNATKLH